MKDSLEFLLSGGYERVGVETFQETVVELLEVDLPNMTEETLFALFNNKGESEHIVWYARVLCAGYMKKNGDRFLPFLPGEWADIHDYCSHEVEPQNKECDQPQIIALAEMLGVTIQIEYLSSSELSEDETTVSLGPSESDIKVCLLYRPGHYDVLYL